MESFDQEANIKIMKVWFGGYTSHDSKGIYTANVENDGTDIKLTNIKNMQIKITTNLFIALFYTKQNKKTT